MLYRGAKGDSTFRWNRCSNRYSYHTPLVVTFELKENITDCPRYLCVRLNQEQEPVYYGSESVFHDGAKNVNITRASAAKPSAPSPHVGSGTEGCQSVD
jgi:hypothetical protein